MCRDRAINAPLNNLLDRYISWPLNQNTQADIAVKLHDKKEFPGILGYIDGTHIKIKAPHEYSQSYVNRKGYHNVVLQAVSLVRLEGRHDSRVLDEERSVLGGCSKAACG